MKLIDLWQSLDAEGKRALAEETGTVVMYLSQIAYGHRRCSQALALKIEGATNQKVSRADLRPDLNPVDQGAPA